MRTSCGPAQYRWSSYQHNGWVSPTHALPHIRYSLPLIERGERQAAYRALFRSELDEEALAYIRLALSQGQPLGQGRFGEQICAAMGIRRTQKRPGRPAGKADQPTGTELQTDFGF